MNLLLFVDLIGDLSMDNWLFSLYAYHVPSHPFRFLLLKILLVKFKMTLLLNFDLC